MIKKIALVTGNFNVLHPGHIRLLKFARNLSNKLIVGVFSDEIAGNAVDAKQEERIEAVEAIGLVDEVLLISNSLEHFITAQKPDVIVKGKEYENRFNPELDILQDYGGQLIFSSGEMGIASESHSGDSIFVPKSTRKLIDAFMTRHGITLQRLIDLIDSFADRKICVLGDIIVDEYIDCFALGMSQEEPTLVVSPQQTTQFLGGAGIVAAHASQLGAEVHFLSVTGQDQARNFAAKVLEKHHVNYSFIVDTARPTTVKQRFRSQGKSLLRVSSLSQQAIPSKLQDLIFAEIEKIVKKVDLIIFSDFNYGCLPQPLVDKIIKVGKLNNVVIAADSQSSSQVGNVSRFKGADLITPTEREARLAIQNYDDGLVVLANKLLSQTNSKYILLKLGTDGLIAQVSENEMITPHTERLSALNPKAEDVSGAGDSVLTTSALSLSSGANLWEASLLGSIAAFIQVGRTGNIPLEKNELLQVMQ